MHIAFPHVFAGIVRVQKTVYGTKMALCLLMSRSRKRKHHPAYFNYDIVRKERLSIIKHTVINFTNEPDYVNFESLVVVE